VVDGIKVWDNKGDINIQMPGSSNKAKNGKNYYNESFKFVNLEHMKMFKEMVKTAYLSQFSK
jgi:hypothetical protein